MERQAHLRALEDASSDKDIQAHLLIAKWIRGFVEVHLPDLLESARHMLESDGKPQDTDYPDGGSEYMLRSTNVDIDETEDKNTLFDQ